MLSRTVAVFLVIATLCCESFLLQSTSKVSLQSRGRGLHLFATISKNDDDDDDTALNDSTRRRYVVSTVAALPCFSPLASLAFEGGIGGLGKTKPETGVVLWDSEEAPPFQNTATGLITAELSLQKQPILVSFTSPWPLLPTTEGLESRDILNPESAFVQVVNDRKLPQTISAVKELLVESVLSQKGKFGAYQTPVDAKVKSLVFKNENSLVTNVTFTTFTPGLRESERQMYVKMIEFNGNIVMLVTGTTRLRFPQKQEILQSVAESLEVVAAPRSSRLR